MKATSRKRLLISSVAMLLVAMLALGTATFAWFTQDTRANAQGLTLKATSANGLKILTQSHFNADNTAEFVKTDYLNYVTTNGGQSSTTPFQLNPASYTVVLTDTANSVAGSVTGPFVTKASLETAKDADGNAAITDGSEGISSGDVYKEKIFCKLVGASDETAKDAIALNQISVSWKDTSSMSAANRNKVEALQAGIRMIVTYTDVDGANSTTKVIGAYAQDAVSNEVSLTETIDAHATEGDNKGYTNATKSTTSFTAFPGANASVAMGDVDTTGGDYVTVYIYLDGEDTGVFTNNIPMYDLIDSVNVNLSIAG